MNIVVLSNIVVEPFFNDFQMQDVDNCKVNFIRIEDVREKSNQLSIKNADEIVVLINFENSFRKMFDELEYNVGASKLTILSVVNYCTSLSNFISNLSRGRILWFSFEKYNNNSNIFKGNIYVSLIDKINIELYDLFCNNDRIIFIDINDMISQIGKPSAFDEKNKCRWEAPYSKQMYEFILAEVRKQIMIEKGISKKCIVLDCDNVLWGGIISEDGIDNIKLGNIGVGRAYRDFQRFLLSLYYNGVILTICSKNDENDVINVLQNHQEMVLKEKQIAYYKINWDRKPSNVLSIANQLNIGLESIVFIDDSPIEIEMMRKVLPEVKSILFDPYTIYKELSSCFNLKANIDVELIEKRNITYKTNAEREELKLRCSNYDEYIEALESKLDIHLAEEIEYGRISELTQRTNKCTNGVRYNLTDIRNKMAKKDGDIYVVYLSDKFSDLGLVGAIEIKNNEIELFSLSCRALGRNIEDKMIKFILNKYDVKKIKFYDTRKNGDLKKLFEKYMKIQ